MIFEEEGVLSGMLELYRGEKDWTVVFNKLHEKLFAEEHPTSLEHNLNTLFVSNLLDMNLSIEEFRKVIKEVYGFGGVDFGRFSPHEEESVRALKNLHKGKVSIWGDMHAKFFSLKNGMASFNQEKLPFLGVMLQELSLGQLQDLSKSNFLGFLTKQFFKRQDVASCCGLLGVLEGGVGFQADVKGSHSVLLSNIFNEMCILSYGYPPKKFWDVLNTLGGVYQDLDNHIVNFLIQKEPLAGRLKVVPELALFFGFLSPNKYIERANAELEKQILSFSKDASNSTNYMPFREVTELKLLETTIKTTFDDSAKMFLKKIKFDEIFTEDVKDGSSFVITNFVSLSVLSCAIKLGLRPKLPGNLLRQIDAHMVDGVDFSQDVLKQFYPSNYGEMKSYFNSLVVSPGLKRTSCQRSLKL